MSQEKASSSESSMQPGEVSWNELITQDTAGAAAFYEGLFGWKASDYMPSGTVENMPPYKLFKLKPGDDGLAGMLAAPSPEVPSHWLPYVVVADVQASSDLAASLGGTVLMPPMDLGEVGKISVIKDPQGAVLGLHQLAG